MKALLSTAGALALIATSAAANPPGNPPLNDNGNGPGNFNNTPASVTLKAQVFEYIAVWGESDDDETQVLQVDGVTGIDGENNNASEKPTFNVTSNVTHDIDLVWDTWDHEGDTQADYSHDTEDCSIGGTVNLDTETDNTSAGIFPASAGNASLSHTGADPTWVKEYGIAAEVTPNITDCPGDIAAPGDYSLDVEITVSKS